MADLDHKLTAAIQEWLNTPEESRDIKAGAEMLLKLNRNIAMYNSAVRFPKKYGAKITYELRKFLRMRLDNMAAADVALLERKVMAKVEDTISEAAISTSCEKPQGAVAKGKRADHDTLPPHIRQIYADNTVRIREISLLFNRLKAMADAQPCDRYELLKILDRTDAEYRKAWQRYDNFTVNADGSVTDEDPDAAKRRVAAARKTLSKYRAVLEKEDDAERRALAVEKIRASVAVIRDAGADISDDTRLSLKGEGIEV
ncbi:MAG: hypothetical protein NC248_11475 [Bacteroides sp.]|nr:hypothetical protein [Bacteroides sp.]MCM1391027.1 hypothetical protein [Bacteroides sp.]